MARYIDKDKVIEEIARLANRSMVGEIDEPLFLMLQLLVQEVIHAKFELVNNGKGVCSNCHRLDYIDNLAKYCRYSIAKMNGGEQE